MTPAAAVSPVRADAVGAATILALFDEQARIHADRAGVMLGGRSLSYRELRASGNGLARRLQSLGLGSDSLVAICMERSIEMVVAVLGVLRSGAAYVPLDPAYPRDRLAFMLDDTRAPVVLTQNHLAGVLPDHPGETILLDGTEAAAAGDQPAPSTPPSPESLAYVIYTSGSTGQPKGVGMRSGALVNLLSWQLTSSAATAGWKTLQFASLSFDVSFQELFSTWCSGGTLVLLTETQRRDAAALLRLLEEERIDRLFLPFVALQHLAETAVETGTFPRSLREVVTAGEQLQITPQIRRFFDGLPGCVLENQYGPSESHVVTAHRLSGPVARWPSLPPIGRAIPNTRVWVLDESGRPLPPGSEGELFIGGDAVARGYLNRPEATAAKFVPDPFSPAPGERLYRTGDLSRLRPDGDVEFLGRIDDQVKIRGYRIEPGEIEAALNRHPGVREAVVVARPDPHGAKQLVGYVVAESESVLSPSELRSFLSKSLPDYMIPGAFVALDALPLTPSGKIDRRSLPAPEAGGAGFERSPYVAPRDAWELKLTKIWEKALGIPAVGVRDNFFELGGYSLVASRIFVALAKESGAQAVGLSPASLLEAPTVESLARLIRDRAGARRWLSLVPIQPGGSRPPLFCMHAGAGTVLFYYELARQLGPDQPVYALQAKGLYGDAVPLGTVEEMAALSLEEMRSVQPHGPYYVGGFCFGAVLAFEVAQRLSRAGERVALLAACDGALPRGGEGQPSVEAELERQRKILPAFRAPENVASLGRKLKNHLSNVLTRWKYALGERYRKSGRPVPEALRDLYFHALHARAEGRYRPAPYAGRMVVFTTRGLFPDPRLGWDRVVRGGVETHEIDYEQRGHRDILSGDAVEAVAKTLRAHLGPGTA